MILCVTNRILCKDNFIERIKQIAQIRPQGILLREKDLSISDYEELAITVNSLCEQYQVKLILHQNISVAKKLHIPYVHLSMPQLRSYRSQMDNHKEPMLAECSLLIGASIHSIEEAIEAYELGASYLIAGHIYATDCKRDLPPRGLPFLQAVCHTVPIPVYGIGGITKERVKEVIHSGATGICIMSEIMTCPNPTQLLQDLQQQCK